MKVAISLPDPIFSAAELLAHKLHVSRSQLYARALEEYLDKRHDPAVLDRLNAVYSTERSNIDPSFLSAQLAAIDHETW